MGNLDKDVEVNYQLHKAESGVYAFVIKGSVNLNGVELSEKDGLGINDINQITIKATNDTELLLMEIPMTVI